MAGDIKGITIKLTGDASGLSKSLREVSAESKKVQGELRGVTSLLKMNPGNTDLIKQKQKLLADQVSRTKDTLTGLKDAQAKMKSDGVDESSKDYRNLQREIASTESKLKRLSDEQIEFTAQHSKLGVLSTKMQDFGSKCTAAAGKLKYATILIGGLGYAAVKAFGEVDDGADKAIAATGATGQSAKDLEKSYKNVATSVVGDFSDIGSGLGEVNTRFGFTGQKLETTTKEFAKFAKVNGTDVTSSVKLVSRAMGDASISSDDYSKVLDALTSAAQASGIGVDELAESVTKYGAPMRNLGYDTEESIAIFAGWEKAGVNTSIAFSGMKKAISNWTASGKDAKSEFKNFISGVKDGSISAQEAMEVFGAKAGPDLVDAIKGGRFEYEDMLKVVQGSKGTLDSTYDGITDGADDAEVAMKQAKVALASIGNTIITELAPYLKKAADWIGRMGDKWDGLSESSQKFIIVSGGIVGAAAPILSTVGKVSQGVGVLTGAFSKMSAKSAAAKGSTSSLSGATGKLKGVVSAVPGPVKALAGAIGVLGLAVYKSYKEETKYSDQQKRNAESRQAEIDKTKTQYATADVYKEKLTKLMGVEKKSGAQKKRIKGYVDLLNGSVDGLNLTYDEETDQLNKSTDAIERKIDAMEQEALAAVYQDKIAAATKDLVEYEDQLAAAKDKKTAAEKRYQALSKSWTDEGTLIKANAAIVNQEDEIKDLNKSIKGTKKEINGYADEAVKAQKETAKIGAKSKAFDKIVTAAKKAGVQIPKSVKKGITDGRYAVPKSVNSMQKLIKYDRMIKRAENAGESIPKSIKNKLKKGTPLTKKEAELLMQKSTDAMQRKSKAASGIGKLAGKLLGDGMSSKKSSVKLKGKSLAQAGKDGAASVKFASVGLNAAGGFAKGLTGSGAVGLLKSAARRMIEIATTAANNAQNAKSPAKLWTRGPGKNSVMGYAKAFDESESIVKPAVTGMMNSAMSVGYSRVASPAVASPATTQISDAIINSSAINQPVATGISDRPIQLIVQLGNNIKLAEEIFKLSERGKVVVGR